MTDFSMLHMTHESYRDEKYVRRHYEIAQTGEIEPTSATGKVALHFTQDDWMPAFDPAIPCEPGDAARPGL